MPSPERIYQDALAALNRRDFANAEVFFKKYLTKRPKHVGALNLLTIVLMSVDRYSEAEEYIVKAIGLDQKSDVSFYNYGLILKRLGKPKQALEQFDKAILINSRVPESWNNRGSVLNDLKQYERAISDFDNAIALNPRYFEAIYNKGNSLSELKRYDEALAAYDTVLAIKPDSAEAWLGRGRVLADLKRYDAAIAACDKALAFKPDLAEAWVARGHLLTDRKRFQEALAAYDKALEFKPDLADAWLGSGHVLTAVKRHKEAFAAYDKTLALKPNLEGAWLGRGHALADLKRFDEAVGAYDKALTFKPDLAEAWLGRGRANLYQEKLDEGRKDYERAQVLGADRDSITFDLARFGIIRNLSAVPRTVVSNLFDDYADRFEQHLVQTLHYDVPANLFNLLRQYIQARSLTVLDLGCGTGLMGALVKPISTILIGVDISQKMLDKARSLQIYDELICKELIEFLDGHSRKYDLVVSTDVFVYLGDLTRVFELVQKVLAFDGYFGFSVESNTSSDFILKETGRYQHSKTYLERLAANNGFIIETIEETVIRQEEKTDVPGFLAILRRG